MIEQAAIAALIPHAGTMCLLDVVTKWDGSTIRCSASSHRSPDNPLRRNGRLGILCGVEYAAQAMAVHAALAGGQTTRPQRGYLASLRAVCCHTDRLDTMAGALTVEAERLIGEASSVIYSFLVRHGDDVLLTGRAGVVIDAGGA